MPIPNMPKSKPTTTHRRFAELLDSRYRIPNTDIRFGVDALIGLAPGIGDWIGGIVSLWFLGYAAYLGGKGSVLLRIGMVILVDVLIGSIPVIGDAFDVYWKANERSAKIIRELQENPDEMARESRLWVWLVFAQLVIIILAVLILAGWMVTELVQLIMQLL